MIIIVKQAGAELDQAQLPTGICLYFDNHLLHYLNQYGTILSSMIATNHYFPIRVSTQNERLPLQLLQLSLVPLTTANHPQNIHLLSICYLPSIYGQFQAVSLLLRVGGDGWVGRNNQD